ncbi:hypothetical protein [Acanthopleuribacter pedis]|uniref:Uncharacterized protein n=1 Tax=Acanthopleuribacter pedis TaxID=442870 RepID=A0A8J7U5V7_9BACT|nr:hypothetical protein [Acanthopleuribacter pedis]MBO1321254.1 hypothetical protein [Acanthopleuribacter pedis]
MEPKIILGSQRLNQVKPVQEQRNTNAADRRDISGAKPLSQALGRAKYQHQIALKGHPDKKPSLNKENIFSASVPKKGSNPNSKYNKGVLKNTLDNLQRKELKHIEKQLVRDLSKVEGLLKDIDNLSSLEGIDLADAKDGIPGYSDPVKFFYQKGLLPKIHLGEQKKLINAASEVLKKGSNYVQNLNETEVAFTLDFMKRYKDGAHAGHSEKDIHKAKKRINTFINMYRSASVPTSKTQPDKAMLRVPESRHKETASRKEVLKALGSLKKMLPELLRVSPFELSRVDKLNDHISNHQIVKFLKDSPVKNILDDPLVSSAVENLENALSFLHRSSARDASFYSPTALGWEKTQK